MNNLDFLSFKKTIQSLQVVSSIQGKQYRLIQVKNNKVYFLREHKNKPEHIDIPELYTFYSKETVYNTSIAKKYISGRKQSPAVALINAINNGTTLSNNNRIKSTPSVRTKKKAKSSTENDETLFFSVLSELLGTEWIWSKSICKPISKNEVFFCADYSEFNFPKHIEQNLYDTLTLLKSDFDFSINSLSHYIDGLLINHPQLGTRIIEFDEEQHFTPPLNFALENILELEEAKALNFIAHYRTIFSDVAYLNNEVLKKHRTNYTFEDVPIDLDAFLIALENQKSSGYIEEKRGFPYLGGRISQRAYYDILRNLAHHSPKNKDFNAVIRFPKKYFEDETKEKFQAIKKADLKDLIIKYLKNVYQITLIETLRDDFGSRNKNIR